MVTYRERRFSQWDRESNRFPYVEEWVCRDLTNYWQYLLLVIGYQLSVIRVVGDHLYKCLAARLSDQAFLRMAPYHPDN